jgi:hypothetical protein
MNGLTIITGGIISEGRDGFSLLYQPRFIDIPHLSLIRSYIAWESLSRM